MHRTQVYLTTEQVRRLKRTARSHKVSMAELIRGAIDEFLRRDARADPDSALERTFGALTDLEVPSRDEWTGRTE
jgi:ribbon-helix-helix CopG family protein